MAMMEFWKIGQGNTLLWILVFPHQGDGGQRLANQQEYRLICGSWASQPFSIFHSFCPLNLPSCLCLGAGNTLELLRWSHSRVGYLASFASEPPGDESPGPLSPLDLMELRQGG